MPETRAYPMFRQQPQQQQKTGPNGQSDADAAAATAAAEAAASTAAAEAAQAAADAAAATTSEGKTPEEREAYWKQRSRQNEERAKTNAEKAQAYDKLVAESATETEKAIAAAKAEGRAEVTSVVATQLVDSKVEALAATAKFLDASIAIALLPKEVRSLAVKEDGTLDVNLLTEAVADLAKDKPYLVGNFRPQPDFSQGGRPVTKASQSADAMKASMERALGRKPAKTP